MNGPHNIPKKIVLTPYRRLSRLLKAREESTQLLYLHHYLSDLEAATVIREPNYFDRDYLDEFSAFYSVTTPGYPNVCERLHFFDDKGISRKVIEMAASGDKAACKRLQKHYLGFIVVRPLPNAPLGRTVLRWYPDRRKPRRVVTPSRRYSVHIAGIELSVEGLAWQQQDRGVASCATIGIWSLLHSSAFDEFHAIPSTTDITRAANTIAAGGPAFPSAGLSHAQLCHAILQQKLMPLIVERDIYVAHANGEPDFLGHLVLDEGAFKPASFAASAAAVVRSGYPALVCGFLIKEAEREVTGRHVACIMGFRGASKRERGPKLSRQDEDLVHVFIHDDNLGPNVRFRLEHRKAIIGRDDQGREIATEIACLVADPPEPRRPPGRKRSATKGYPVIVPHRLIFAAHHDVRIKPGVMINALNDFAIGVHRMLDISSKMRGQPARGITHGCRYVKLSEYLGNILEDTLKGRGSALAKLRLELCERVRPMSLHIGVGRLGLADSTPLVDVLYDTTENHVVQSVFAYVCFNAEVEAAVRWLCDRRICAPSEVIAAH